MQNIVEVREQLTEVFKDLRSGILEPKVAAELNNSAGKIINTIKVELEYFALRKEKPKIKFLEA